MIKTELSGRGGDKWNSWQHNSGKERKYIRITRKNKGNYIQKDPIMTEEKMRWSQGKGK